MIRLVAAAVLALVPPSYVEEVAAGWADDPVHVSSRSGALDPDDADELRGRIDAWRDDFRVAVLPAVALHEMPGDREPEQAMEFIERLHTAFGRDGVYVVAFGGVGTYGAAYGTDDQVGPIVARQVAAHTISELDQTLHGILDELGAPESPKDEGSGAVPWLVAGVAVLVLAGAALLLHRRRRAAPGFAGPAPYRPSFRVHADEHDTVEERAALAREDVTRLGEELDRSDLPSTDPAVAAHVQAALDAYHEASRRVDALTTDEELRALGDIADYARWQAACARARLDGTPLPARRSPCFLDPGHGLSVADWTWAPPGGVPRPVPLCRPCLDRISTGGPA